MLDSVATQIEALSQDYFTIGNKRRMPSERDLKIFLYSSPAPVADTRGVAHCGS